MSSSADTRNVLTRIFVPLHMLLPVALLGLALQLGDLDLGGLLGGLLYAGWVLHGPARRAPRLWWSVSLVASLALLAHLLPGFSPRPLWPAVQLSADAAPYALRLNWDGLLVGLTLLLRYQAPRTPHPRAGWPQLLVCCGLTLLLVPALALALDVVDWQPKWPALLALWLAVNLWMSVLAEELLFRAWLQRALIARWGATTGLCLTAALFGAAHLPFSAGFALVAGVAGLGYGLIYLLSGRLALAMMLHLGVNLLHLLLLSYPLKSV